MPDNAKKEQDERPSFSQQYMERQHEGGLVCAKCGCHHLPVQSTRKWTTGKVLRTRICRNCGQKVETLEQEIPKSGGV